MTDQFIPAGALVLYKGKPARVARAADKLEIEIEGGGTAKVRSKDVALLHPGPIQSLGELHHLPDGDLNTAWELLSGQSVPLSELAELAYGEFSPAAAWAAWQQVTEGLYFRGNPEAVAAVSADEVARLTVSRQLQAAEEQAWRSFVERAGAGSFESEDQRYLREIEDLALKQRQDSRVLRELKRSDTPENAHAFLLELGYWDETYNPYPTRLGVSLSPPELSLPDLPEEDRLDLTHLPSFAIDDEGNRDPDDAISLDGERIWVHVADVAALVQPGSPVDIEARARGANLYLPEFTVPILPEEATPRLALGLKEVSPALSFGLTLNSNGEIGEIKIAPSWVRVQRLTYEQAQADISQEPFIRLSAITNLYMARRQRQGALFIDLPEVKLHVEDGRVNIQPVLPLPSRALVREAMLMAGEAAAIFTLRNNIPAPFAVQNSSEPIPVEEQPEKASETNLHNMSAMFALRRAQNRGQVSSNPAPHSGLGLTAYVRATSPLRRYLDLVAHQQIRSFLRGRTPMDEQEMIERVGASEAVTGGVAQTESLSRRHWTLVYFIQNPGWRGEGILIEKRGQRGRVIIPELAYETWVGLRGDPALDSHLKLAFRGANLPELEGFFRVE